MNTQRRLDIFCEPLSFWQNVQSNTKEHMDINNLLTHTPGFSSPSMLLLLACTSPQPPAPYTSNIIKEYIKPQVCVTGNETLYKIKHKSPSE